MVWSGGGVPHLAAPPACSLKPWGAAWTMTAPSSLLHLPLINLSVVVSCFSQLYCSQELSIFERETCQATLSLPRGLQKEERQKVNNRWHSLPAALTCLPSAYGPLAEEMHQIPCGTHDHCFTVAGVALACPASIQPCDIFASRSGTAWRHTEQPLWPPVTSWNPSTGASCMSRSACPYRLNPIISSLASGVPENCEQKSVHHFFLPVSMKTEPQLLSLHGYNRPFLHQFEKSEKGVMPSPCHLPATCSLESLVCICPDSPLPW